MLVSDTNNIYHTIIYNLLIALLGRSEEIFVIDNVFARWLNRVAHIYQKSVSSSSSNKAHPQCFFGHVYKLLKLILGLNNNFLKKMLDNNCDLVVEAFEIFYYPKADIEKREYPIVNEKLTTWEDSIDKFDGEDSEKSEEDSEKAEHDFASLHAKEIIEFQFSDQEKEEDEDKEASEPANAEQTSFNDVNFWRTRISFDEESIKDLLS